MANTATGYELEAHRSRFNALASRHLDGTAPKAVSSFNLFQTPPHIAERMAAIADIPEGGRVLEPSAGLGRLYQAITNQSPSCRVTLVEESAACCSGLYRVARDGDRLLQRDFLELSPDELLLFDAVVMNPPFKMGADIRHIRHAFQFLKLGGKVVSLCYDGARQNEKLKPVCDTWEVLPEGSFKSEGTGAGVALLTITKTEQKATL